MKPLKPKSGAKLLLPGICCQVLIQMWECRLMVLLSKTSIKYFQWWNALCCVETEIRSGACMCVYFFLFIGHLKCCSNVQQRNFIINFSSSRFRCDVNWVFSLADWAAVPNQMVSFSFDILVILGWYLCLGFMLIWLQQTHFSESKLKKFCVCGGVLSPTERVDWFAHCHSTSHHRTAQFIQNEVKTQRIHVSNVLVLCRCTATVEIRFYRSSKTHRIHLKIVA